MNAETVKRRFITLPLLVVCFLISWALLPLWLAMALVLDLVKRKQWITLRCTVVLIAYITAEFIGTLYALICTPLLFGPRQTMLRAHFAIQVWWARTLYGTMERAFRLNTIVTGQQDALRDGGPIVVMVRHASQIDSLLPAAFVSHHSNIMLRYVLKHELLWSPAMDWVGNRLQNHFVKRKAMSARQEIQKIHDLALEMGPQEGAIIFPEGTRFSVKKRDRLLKVMAKRSNTELYNMAKQLTHMLPPNIAGPKALLEACPKADVVFVAHCGFDGMRTAKHLFAGGIVGRTVYIHMWRVPRQSFAHEDIEHWLFAQWQRVDDWVDTHTEPNVELT